MGVMKKISKCTVILLHFNSYDIKSMRICKSNVVIFCSNISENMRMGIVF